MRAVSEACQTQVWVLWGPHGQEQQELRALDLPKPGGLCRECRLVLVSEDMSPIQALPISIFGAGTTEPTTPGLLTMTWESVRTAQLPEACCGGRCAESFHMGILGEESSLSMWFLHLDQ